MTLGTRIKTLRKAQGLTQVALAKRAGIVQSSLSEIERGETKKGFGETIVRLARALNTSPEWLTTGVGSPAPSIHGTIEQSECIAIFNALPPALRAAWIASGRALLNSDPVPSTANPFPKAKI